MTASQLFQILLKTWTLATPCVKTEKLFKREPVPGSKIVEKGDRLPAFSIVSTDREPGRGYLRGQLHVLV